MAVPYGRFYDEPSYPLDEEQMESFSDYVMDEDMPDDLMDTAILEGAASFPPFFEDDEPSGGSFRA